VNKIHPLNNLIPSTPVTLNLRDRTISNDLLQNLDSSMKSQTKSLQDEDSKEVIGQWKKNVRKILNSYWWIGSMSLITVYALFFDDVRIILFKKSTDYAFDAATFFGICMYSVEIVLASLAEQNYFLEFFFWLDLIATLSMVPDCGWIWNLLLQL